MTIQDELHSINYLDRLAIPELCGKNFFIPDYQRGYRWGETQVRQLLEDLYNFFYNKDAAGSFYCLQPVVVKKLNEDKIESYNLSSNFDNNTWYEVIDGQQRLTTIRIILAIANRIKMKKKAFNLHYQTRNQLGMIFNSFILEQADDDSEDDAKIDIHLENENNLDIDSWHILKAAQFILNWFQTGKPKSPTIDQFTGTFYEMLTGEKDISNHKSVQVIWYELRDNSDPYEMFKRLNDKSVSLNNAELIRAIFLSDSARYNCEDNFINNFDEKVRCIVEQREQARKQSHIIEMWDIIEQKLRDNNFWGFVYKDISKNYSNRIEYLFDLISKKAKDERDNLFTYLSFEKMITTDFDLWKLWLKIESYFSTLQAWYVDRYFYHKIGYLVTVAGSSTLIDLLEKAENTPKDKFKEIITDKIKETITDRKDKSRSILDFDYEHDYNLLKTALLLYNIESVYQHNNFDMFPFNDFKNVEWTLEHIHAQNSEKIDQRDKSKWLDWLIENEKALRKLSTRLSNDVDLSTLQSRVGIEIDQLKNNGDKYTFASIVTIFDSVQQYFDNLCKEEGRPSEVHGISNMALLGGGVNSSIGNCVFEVKRQKIMENDAKGVYIPLCTRNVFLKYYNKNNSNFSVQQTFYWSEKDRINYLEDIKTVMKDYIPFKTNKSVNVLNSSFNEIIEENV